MRQFFGSTLNELASKDKKIVLLLADVSFGSLDQFKKSFPDRTFDFGLSEQTMISAAAGMASQGLKPVLHTLTPFLLERPFEQIKIDIDENNLPVIMVGYDDYPTYGPTHRALDVPKTIDLFKNVHGYYPTTKEEVVKAVINAYLMEEPAFIWLRKETINYIPMSLYE